MLVFMMPCKRAHGVHSFIGNSAYPVQTRTFERHDILWISPQPPADLRPLFAERMKPIRPLPVRQSPNDAHMGAIIQT